LIALSHLITDGILLSRFISQFNLGQSLTEEQLTEWLSNYDFSTNDTKTVALILAGNIPLVGFHDFYLLISGHNVKNKTSSDQHLLPFIKYIIAVAPEFAAKITLSKVN
jgi:hypothetical protein